MTEQFLYYADGYYVRELPWTKNRAANPHVFHATRASALQEITSRLEEEIQTRVKRRMEIERELARLAAAKSPHSEATATQGERLGVKR